MNIEDVLKQLETLGSEKVRAQNIEKGANENQYGVKLGDIRGVANNIKHNPELALELWKPKNLDARLLAILSLKPKDLSSKELDEMVSRQK